MTAIPLLALFVLPLVGFALIAASQDQHRRAMALTPAAMPARRRSRVIAGSFIFVSLPLAIWLEGPGLGSLLWGALLSAAACVVTVILSVQPRWLRQFAR